MGMKAVILSGGQGLRMRPLTNDRPKPLVEVNGRPIAEHQIDWLTKDSAVDGVVFACGYKWEKLRDHFGSGYKGIPIEYSVEEEPLGSGGAIRKAITAHSSEEEFIVLNGDIVTDLVLKRMVDSHHNSGEIAGTMLVVPYKSSFGVVTSSRQYAASKRNQLSQTSGSTAASTS
jgi:NDP-sugar pyrophosphorylase family protein